VNSIIVTWAKLEARKAVKRELQSKGEKVAHVPLRKIAELAEAYLRAHPMLFEQAAEKVRKSPALQAMADREEHRRVNRAKRAAVRERQKRGRK
jgi:hypothetical protein